MKKILLAVCAVAAVALVATVVPNQSHGDARVRAALSGEPCPETAPRVYAVGSYAGPLWDTHIHIPAISEGAVGGAVAALLTGDRPVLGVNVDMDAIACTFQAEGTEKVFAFFSVWKEMAEPMVDVVVGTLEAYPDLFVPFIMPPDHDDSPDGFPTVDAPTLASMLAIAPGLFEGFGEIGLYARNGGSPELPPDDPRLLEIYPLVVEHGLLVYVHLGVGHQDNLERAAELYPEINFIFHGDQLVVYEI